MPQQRSFRLGWQSENLARYILYKFSFVAQPFQIVDDIGVDFFCTVFETQYKQTNADLIPRNSFAIQIKSESDSSTIELTRHLTYLENLELPFFIGIINRTNLTLSLYSGELLTPFFAYKGKPDRLEVELINNLDLDQDYSDWYREYSPGNFVLPFPKIAVITVGMDAEQLEERVNRIRQKCSSMLSNIAARINKQFIMHGVSPGHQLLFAGPESIKYFEANFLDRLTEVFFNLKWAYESQEVLRPQIVERFRLYEGIYKNVTEYFEEDSPPLLSSTYLSARTCICK